MPRDINFRKIKPFRTFFTAHAQNGHICTSGLQSAITNGFSGPISYLEHELRDNGIGIVLLHRIAIQGH